MNKSVLIALVLLLVAWGEQGHGIAEAGADTDVRGAAESPTGEVSAERASSQLAEQARASAQQSSADEYDLVLGEAVFTDKCLTCHGKGAHDAPVFGNAADWERRLKQDLDTLIRHAIHGHRRMPPRGGFSELTDHEVAAAVAYAVDESGKIVAAMKEQRRDRGCDPINNLDACSASELKEMFTLQMILLLGGSE